jgi:PAS domain S-box-containing protein
MPIVVDREGRIVRLSRSSAALLGRALDDARGRRLRDLLPSDAAACVHEALDAAERDGGSRTVEIALPLWGGAERTLALSVSALDGDEGHAPWFALHGVDISALITRQRGAMARLEALLEQAPDGIFVADLDGRYTDVNDAGCRLLGMSRDEIIGKTIVDLLPPEEAARLWESREHLLRGEIHVADWMLRRKDGRYVPVEVSAKILPDGRWQGLVRDISRRKALERALVETNDDLRRAQSVAKVGSWRIDTTRGGLVWSDETYRIFEIPRGTPLTYDDFLARVHPDDRAYVDASWSAARRRERPYDIEHRIIAGARVKWVRERADLEIDETGAVRRGFGVVVDTTEHHAAEEVREELLAVIDSERRMLRGMLDIAPLGIVFFELTGVLYVNRRAEELLGRRLSPTLGSAQVLGSILDLDGRPVPETELPSERALRNGETTIARELVIDRPDGTRVPVLASAAPLRDDDGRVVGGVGMFQDVSDKMRTAEARRLSEERLRVALQAAPATVFNQDLQLRFTWIQSARFRPEEVLGRTDHDLLAPADAARLTTLKRRVLETGVGTRAVVPVTDGAEVLFFDVSIEPLRDERGRIVGITCAGWDVTSQRRREEQQRLLARAGAIAVRSTPDVQGLLAHIGELVVRDLADWFFVDIVEEGQVRRTRVAHADPANAALAAELTEVLLDRERRHLMTDALHGRRSALWPEVAPSEVETFAQHEEHLRILRAIQIRSLITVPLEARGRLLGALALISSRPSRRYGDEELRVAEELARIVALAVDNAQLHRETQRAIAAREEILGIVAHDLRNPLTTVLLKAATLRRVVEPRAPESVRDLDAIQRAAQRMHRLIQDMLDVTRGERGLLAIQRAPVSAHDLVTEAVDTQREALARAGLLLGVGLTEALPDVWGDHDRLLQVFDNLIGNAIKFTARGGEVIVGAATDTHEVRFHVANSGESIPAEELPRLFDRFWQGRRGDRRGVGLGLSIVKAIVEAHGGRIWVESEPGEGCTFTFTVPIAAGADEGGDASAGAGAQADGRAQG